MAGSRLEKWAQRENGLADLSGRLVTARDPNAGTSEAYRVLRTNLLCSLPDAPPAVIVVTSPGPSEGKSTVCANLGVVLAQAGNEVLVVDCHLREPSMHKIFGVRESPGLTEILTERRGILETCQSPRPPQMGLKVIVTGSPFPTPDELLGSVNMSEFLTYIRAEFDYVLVDSPPLKQFVDPTILSIQSDGVMIVLDAQGTRKDEVRQTIRALQAAGANVLGTVMNNVPGSKDSRWAR